MSRVKESPEDATVIENWILGSKGGHVSKKVILEKDKIIREVDSFYSGNKYSSHVSESLIKEKLVIQYSFKDQYLAIYCFSVDENLPELVRGGVEFIDMVHPSENNKLSNHEMISESKKIIKYWGINTD